MKLFLDPKNRTGKLRVDDNVKDIFKKRNRGFPIMSTEIVYRKFDSTFKMIIIGIYCTSISHISYNPYNTI
jgi:hypothetical protein